MTGFGMPRREITKCVFAPIEILGRKMTHKDGAENLTKDKLSLHLCIDHALKRYLFKVLSLQLIP